MDSRIAFGDKLELKKIENRLSVRLEKRIELYGSQVLDETENGDILISMPVQEGKMARLRPGQECSATFYTKSGLLQCGVEVTGCYKKDALLLMGISPKTALKKVQRREYFRFECRKPLKYRVLNEVERTMLEDGAAYNPDELELEWRNAVILDVSGGGIRFVTPFQEERGSLLEVQFEITEGEEVEMVYAYASLLRCEQTENNANLYDSRVMFWQMDNGMREKIIRYIFDEQRKLRSKKPGMN